MVSVVPFHVSPCVPVTVSVDRVVEAAGAVVPSASFELTRHPKGVAGLFARGLSRDLAPFGRGTAVDLPRNLVVY